MKKIVFLFFLLSVLSCSTTKKADQLTSNRIPSVSSVHNNVPAKVIVDENHNGTSFEKAIIIKETNESNGVKAEYNWIRINFPGMKVKGQMCSHKNNKIYDIISFITSEGKEKEIYFDITDFYGKF